MLNRIFKSFATVSVLFSFMLCSCSSQTKVSKEEFYEKASKVKGHQYSKATLKIKAHFVYGSTDNARDINGEFHYTYQDDKWCSDEEGAYEKDVYVYLYQNLLDDLVKIDKNLVVFPKDYEMDFYLNPFEITIDGYEENESIGECFSMTGSMTYDKYGHLINLCGYDSHTYKEGFTNKLTIINDVRVEITYK